MPHFDLTIAGVTYHVEVPDPGATPLRIIVDGQAFEVEIAGTETAATRPAAAPLQGSLTPPPRQARAASASSTVAAQGLEVSAPMPGTILSVDVKSGQTVEPGQVLCVLEAMKMKNPIRATVGGIVAEIAIQVGQTVSYGDLLVRLE